MITEQDIEGWRKSWTGNYLAPYQAPDLQKCGRQLMELCDLALKGLRASTVPEGATQDAKDAARYRWLRQSNCRDGVPFIAIFDGRLSQWTGKFADEQVDAAMSSSPPQNGESK